MALSLSTCYTARVNTDMEVSVQEPLNDEQVKALETQYEQAMAVELAKMAEYKKALEQEFENADPNDPVTAEKARKHVISLVPDATTQAKHLLNHAESESIRAGLAKFIINIAIRHAEDNSEEDEMQKLVNSLTKATDN